MKSNLILLGCFILGIALSSFGLIPTEIVESDLSSYLLYALVFVVGLTIGSDVETLKGFLRLPKRIILLPLLTIVGGLIGGAFAAIVFKQEIFTTLAIASGLGYYSLSGIIITEKIGIVAGTIALLSNIAREILTITLSPRLVRWFGPLAPISSGGATTADVTLKFILESSGKDHLVTSVYHGVVCDFSVPIFVSLFCELYG